MRESCIMKSRGSFKPGTARILAAALVLIFGFSSCGGENPDEVASASYKGDGSEEPRPVEALRLVPGKLISRVSGSGVIMGREEAWITSETQGTVTEVFVSPGDFVVKGDPLLRVDDTLAYWDMKRAEQQFKTSDFEYRGKKNSFESGAVSEIEYNRSYASWYTSRAAYEAAVRAYENCTLRAPLAGHVSRMDTTLTPGNFLRQGTAVMKIINTDEFILNIALGQGEVGLISPDAPADVFIDLTDRNLSGKGSVLDISAGSDGETGSFPVRVVWKNTWDGLVKPGMTARVDVETPNTGESIIIPFDSIIEREGKQWVFLAQEEEGFLRARPREVIPGPRLGNRIIISEGLGEGEILITSGLTSLYPGAPVKLSVREK